MLRARSEFLILFSLTFGLFLQKLTANGFTDWQEDGLLRQEALTAMWQLRQTDLKTDNKPLLVSSTPPVFWVHRLQMHVCFSFMHWLHFFADVFVFILQQTDNNKQSYRPISLCDNISDINLFNHLFQLWTLEEFLVCSIKVLFLLVTHVELSWCGQINPSSGFCLGSVSLRQKLTFDASANIKSATESQMCWK